MYHAAIAPRRQPAIWGASHAENPHAMTRRAMVASAAAMVAARRSRECQIGPPKHQKGPPGLPGLRPGRARCRIRSELLRAALPHIRKRYVTNSEAVRAPPRRAAARCLWPDRVEKLDIYRASDQRAGLRLHSWRRLAARRAKDYRVPGGDVRQRRRALRRARLRRGQGAGGNSASMAEQVRRAIAWIYHNAASFGGDPSASTSAAIPRAVTSAASRWSPTGRRTSVFRPTSSKAACA